MSYVAIKAGLLSVVRDVVPRTYGYEPQNIEGPAAYVLAQDGDGRETGQMVSDEHRLIVRVAVPWTQNERAEEQLSPYIDSVPAALRAARNPGGATLTTYTGYSAGFWQVSGITWRVCDFRVTALDKR